MTLKISVIFNLIKISSQLILVLLRISTNRATKIIKIVLYLFKFLKARRYQIDVLNINIIHNEVSVRSNYSIRLLQFVNTETGDYSSPFDDRIGKFLKGIECRFLLSFHWPNANTPLFILAKIRWFWLLTKLSFSYLMHFTWSPPPRGKC